MKRVVCPRFVRTAPSIMREWKLATHRPLRMTSIHVFIICFSRLFGRSQMSVYINSVRL